MALAQRERQRTMMGDLRVWLEELGLGEYDALFAEQRIDFEILPELTEQDLKDIGIPLGHRKKLGKAIAALRETPTTEPAAAPLSAATPAATAGAERRQLTVMFCDLVGSTALSVRLDPEDMREIIRGYQDCCASVIQRFEGHIARFLGDGVLAYFGYPIAHEDNAERAVRAGLTLIEAITELHPRPGLDLQVRIGIATGPVVVGDIIGAAAAQEEAVVGETPNLAARLQALAKPNTLVIGALTRYLAGELFEYIDLGAPSLKGFGEPIRTWQVVRARQIESRFEATRAAHVLTTLVGRNEELELLLRRWQQAKAGEGQVVLLSGEAGIGKSRLVQALLEQISGTPHIRWRFYGAPYYQNSALASVIQQLERAIRLNRDDPPAAKLDKLEEYLRQSLMPSADYALLLAQLLSLPGTERYGQITISREMVKARTFEALEALLLGSAHRQPVVAVFEDLHWIDPTTLELIERLATHAQNLPMLLLLTSRPGFTAGWIDTAWITALSLSRLNQQDGLAIVDALTAHKALPPEVLNQIIAKADGVPLFLEELTKAVLEVGFLRDNGDHYTLTGPLPPLAVPSTLQDSLMARLDRLALSKDVAQTAAALGRQFSFELLAAVSPPAERSLASSLAQLVAANLIYGRGTPPQAIYTFKHALVQEAAYNSLLKSKRQLLHARIAQTLEGQFPEQTANEPELLAHHYTEAGLGAQAIEYWHKASQRALGRSAYAEALANVDKGLALIEQLPADQERDRLELKLQLARAGALRASRGMTFPEVVSAFTRARSLCARLDEAIDILPVLFGIGGFHNNRGEHGLAVEIAAECLRAAQAQPDPAHRIWAHRLSGVGLLDMGEIVEARRHLEAVIALYDPERHQAVAVTYGLFDLKTGALMHLSNALCLLGFPDRALAVGQEVRLHAESLGFAHNLAIATAIANNVYLFRGDFVHACQQAETLLALTRKRGLGDIALFVEGQRAIALIGMGDLRTGVQALRTVIATQHATGLMLNIPYRYGVLAEALGLIGEPDEAFTALAAGLEWTAQSHGRLFAAELWRIKGELLRQQPTAMASQDAEDAFRQALAIARAQQAKLWELRAALGLARLWRDQDNHAAAHDLLATALAGFTEGFEMAIWQEAKSALSALATPL
ncbi:MAG: AAA family ATPase [Gammaproteobacteria bacterium]